ncbi:MAG: CPBP family intramembrane metalloprotease [Clostridiales bacterium]|nr:CPBP family intramembrane metalloprotease [Clostridiales bacterium]
MDKKKFFSTTGFAYFMLVVLWIGVQMLFSIIIQAVAPGSIYRHPLLYWVLSCAPLYLAAMPVCARIMRRLPAMKLYKNKMTGSKWFSTLCIAVFITFAGNLIGNGVSALLSRLTGLEITSSIEEMLTGGDLGYVFLFSVILAPILEELVFRKLLIDRVIVFGDRTAILLSGLFFGMIHGNFYQFFYAFGLGCLFAYVYIRTGKIGYSISFHMAINFLNGFLTSALLDRLDYEQWISGSSTEYMIAAVFSHLGALIGLGLLLLLLFGLGIAGLVFFIMSLRKIDLYSGEYEMPAGQTFRTVFGNIGTVLFLISIVVLFILNIIP